VRHAFNKCGGNLGTDGSVVFQFKHCGQIILAPGADEDKVMEVALEAGAEDVVSNEDGSIEVLTAPNNDLATVKEALDAAGLTTVMAEIAMKALNETDVSGDDVVKFQKMLDMLDDLDDVQEVFTSAILPDE
jgi:transcriptional/translational regulatory protein YebC/TACO1